jgi:hypothetical protein
MPLTYNPVNVSIPNSPTYAGGKMGSSNTNLLSTLGDLTAIDTQQQALKKSQATFGADVARAQADSERAQTEAKRAGVTLGNEQMNSMYTVLTPYASDKRLLQAESLTPNATPDQIKAVQNGLFDIGDEVKQKLKSMGWSNADAMQYVNDFNSSVLKDPRQAPNDIKRATQSLAGALNISQQNQPQVSTVNGQTTTIVPSRGVVPLQGMQQPDVPVIPTEETKGVTQGQMSMPPMQYPVRKAGEAYAQLPNEPKDLEDGRTYRGIIVEAQGKLPTMRRNVEEVIKEASRLEKTAFNEGAGFTGKVGREISTFLGTEEGIRYKQLSKDLANAQLTTIAASGGSLNTDAGKQLSAMANGDVTYPPKVLQQIARRTQADMSDLDMKATAAQKFTKLYGDQNINTFKQMWSANSDTKLFELKNIYDNPDLSEKEKDQARTELLGTNKKSLEEYARKWKNIQKLEKTGTL